MKTLFFTLFTGITLFLNVETETITATFTGYSEDTYYFEDSDELVHSFETLNEAVAKQYDLTTDAYKGKVFKVTYTMTTEVNEDDEEYDSFTIIALELIK